MLSRHLEDQIKELKRRIEYLEIYNKRKGKRIRELEKSMEAQQAKFDMQYRRLQNLIDGNMKRTPRFKNARHEG